MSTEKQPSSKVTYLAPTGRANTNSEDGKEPSMNLAEPGEECEEGTPDTDEEDDDKDEDLPFLEVVAPQEGPVLSVGLGKGGSETKNANGQIILTLLNQ